MEMTRKEIKEHLQDFPKQKTLEKEEASFPVRRGELHPQSPGAPTPELPVTSPLLLPNPGGGPRS